MCPVHTAHARFSQVENAYNDDNQYHNKAHAANVLQQTHAILLHGGVAAQIGAPQLCVC